MNELNANGLENRTPSLQLDHIDSKSDAAAPQLYSTIPESYKQHKLGSSEETQKQQQVINTYELEDP